MRVCTRILALLHLDRAELSVLIVGPRAMRALNREYRGMDRTTDVLSFPQYGLAEGLPEDGPFAMGDVVVDIERAGEQAREFGHSLDMELRRLLVHGVLHLAGYDHEGGARERERMRRKERSLLLALGRE
jgi:probable rRNA maturation factor